MAINSEPRAGRGARQQRGFRFQGCKTAAKWSTLYTDNPAGDGQAGVRPDAMVLRIEHGGRGKPTGLVYADAQGNRHRQEARVVCVAGNSIESPRLPLSSASPMFTGAACNPTVTIVALAIRQAEHLAGRMARGEV